MSYVGTDNKEEGVINLLTKVVLFQLSIAGEQELARQTTGVGTETGRQT